MATYYKKYILSTGTHYISNSGGDEKGGIKGGKAGDQTGKEWQLKKWYNRPWNHVLRYPDINVGTLIAQLSIDAALNNHVGYDQGQRTTYWAQLKKVGYLPAKITTNCEEDCSAGVSSNVRAAGYLLGIKALQTVPICSSRNMLAQFKKAGFKDLTASKYTKGYNDLLPGDVLLYVGHHAAANVTKGKNVTYTYVDVIADASKYAPDAGPKLGDRDLQVGDTGPDVKEMQEDLVKLGWSFPKYGCDGDFGSETEANVKGFQRVSAIHVTGIFDRVTYDALMAALHNRVEITGESVNVRSGPGTKYVILGVVHKGDYLGYGGQRSADGWYLVEYKGMNAWVSGKFARLA